MVARINTGKNIAKSLNYNEQKVHAEKAELISASGFLQEPDTMSFYQKMWHFERLIKLNKKATTNALHVSLNFDPSEKLDKSTLVEIANRYMENIGFADQPYLVYRHDDAGHPHIHIVSTNIQTNGNRISMHNMGRNQSERARKSIEVEFGLVKAEDRKNRKASELVPVNAYKAMYGKAETRQAISNVLGVVINQFRFTSLPELNAILRLYNVQADPGAHGSRINKHKGLTYRILDEKGNKVGVPIKASSFFMKPTLKLLESKYAENESLRQPFKRRFAVEIEFSLAKKPRTIMDFSENLSRVGINVILRQNSEGLIYGITYVDLKTKSVFNGSDLGKEYSAKGILERLELGERPAQNSGLKPVVSGQLTSYYEDSKPNDKNDMLDILLRPENIPENIVPYPFKKDVKKKKKRGLSI
jgi:Relaxase/Mobilisation nuclease domain